MTEKPSLPITKELKSHLKTRIKRKTKDRRRDFWTFTLIRTSDGRREILLQRERSLGPKETSY